MAFEFFHWMYVCDCVLKFMCTCLRTLAYRSHKVEFPLKCFAIFIPTIFPWHLFSDPFSVYTMVSSWLHTMQIIHIYPIHLTSIWLRKMLHQFLLLYVQIRGQVRAIFTPFSFFSSASSLSRYGCLCVRHELQIKILNALSVHFTHKRAFLDVFIHIPHYI